MEIENVSEGIDRLITLDLGARGVIYKLYEAARKNVGKPLTLKAAEEIDKKVNKGDYIIIATGFRVLPDAIQETDGPLGAASLARCLKKSYGVKSIILIEEASVNIMKAALKALEIKVTADEDVFTSKDEYMLVRGFPYKVDEAKEAAEYIVNKYNPSLLISIEKAGSNEVGEYHTMRGMNITRYHSKIEAIVEEVSRNNGLTIGIGDGGNEVGMGNILDAVKKYVPYADRCQCPCGKGIAAVSKVDVLITAAVSNWGGYGLEAIIALIKGVKDALHDEAMEESMLINIVNENAVDGVKGEPILSVDGIPLDVHKAVVKMLRTFIR